MKDTNNVTSLDTAEQIYQHKTSIGHRKKFAQFFTPLEIAQIMCSWILGNKNITSILEPAFGLGIFSRILLKENPSLQIKAFEIDSTIHNFAKDIFESFQSDIDVQLKDYIYNDWDKKYDGIICNPPYLKFHDYSNKEALFKFEQETNFKLNGFSNLYVIFLLKSLFQLGKNGRMAYIIPSEFQNSDYGERVKEFILNHGSLRYIININSKEKTFNDAITTACILLFSNDDLHSDVEFINVDDISKIKDITRVIYDYPLKHNNLEHFCIRTVPQKELNASIKWKNYSQESKLQSYRDLVPFSKYGKVSRGIATGCNDFFTMNCTKIKIFNIDQRYLSPCVCKSIKLKSSFFTQDTFDLLLKKNIPVYLLDVSDEEDSNIRRYLELGVNQGVSKKHLTSKRNPIVQRLRYLI
jgi:adenine-specific DNA-methyltransferase